MCGIVGYVGNGKQGVGASDNPALNVLIEGLRRLEYRGYDSAGVALICDDGIEYRKKAGKLKNLEAEIKKHPLKKSVTGIGHTRWATHGAPTDENAHPHIVNKEKLALIHNGIIENFAELKQELIGEGVKFKSETDSEVAAWYLARIYDEVGDLTQAMQKASQKFKGAFTLLAIHEDEPHKIVASRKNSPLVLGLGDGENFLGSDVAAFIDHTRRAVELGQDQVVTITPDDVEITDFYGKPAEGKEYKVDWDAKSAQKDGYDSFMEKEINEQPAAIAQTVRGRINSQGKISLDELRIDESVLRSIDKIIVIACGTAAYAGQVARYAIEHWCRIPVEVELAHEFRYRDPIVNDKTLVVAISQSGETMDTAMAVRHAQEQGAKVLAICNTVGSTIPREADAVLYTHAGPEIAVASTKAFTAQIAAAYLLGLYLAQVRGNKFPDEIKGILEDIEKAGEDVQQILDNSSEQINDLALKLKDTKSVLFLGRHVGYPVAMEGALKLKEIAYIHAEGFAAGELKHGPIALIEEGQNVIIVVPSPLGRDSLHSKVVSNIQEIRARGARTIVIAEEGDEEVKDQADEIIYVPKTQSLLMPLLTTVPLQLFACDLASAKGYDVDQPRNLAKSVTVE
ncbi:MAG: glutamine--fructose-6-phosphate transaminase (isomerizing) [Micrococcaceae bacterium]